MNILMLTKMKPVHLNDNVRSVYDYLEYDYFFEGYYDAFRELGHKVFPMWDESFFIPPVVKLRCYPIYRALSFFLRKTGLRRVDRYVLSRKIAVLCRENEIDWIFTEINPFVSPNIIRKLCKGVKVTQWYGIFPEMSDKYTLRVLPEYDVIWGPCEFDTTKVYFKGIEKFKYIGCAVNRKRFYKDYDKRFAYDVVFVGGISKGHLGRLELLEVIASRYENFAFYGYGYENIPLGYTLRNKFKGWANVNIIRKLYSSSKVIVNLTLDGYEKIRRGFNSRLFEIASCNGGVQLVKNDEKLSDFFVVGKEIDTFNCTSDLTEKIDYYLSHDQLRKHMAKLAYEKSRRYTYLERAKVMCDIMSSLS